MSEFPPPPAEDERIAFVLTSCGRFDLLEETLATFLAVNTAPIARYIVIEDSGDAGVRDVAASVAAPIEVIVNERRLGQLASIDRAYGAVDTPYIFHCEDDWRFFRGGFIEESLALLRHDPAISTVLSRRPGQNAGHDLVRRVPVQSLDGIRYRKAPLWLVREWLGYSFNPGLRRLADYRRLGAFARLGSEMDVSLFFKNRGMALAALEEPACETSGRERRVAPPPPPASWRARRVRAEGLVRYALAKGLRYTVATGVRTLIGRSR